MSRITTAPRVQRAPLTATGRVDVTSAGEQRDHDIDPACAARVA